MENPRSIGRFILFMLIAISVGVTAAIVVHLHSH